MNDKERFRGISHRRFQVLAKVRILRQRSKIPARKIFGFPRGSPVMDFPTFGTIADRIHDLLNLYFPPEWLKAALALSLISTWVLVALFAYLNRYTRRQYFGLWTAGWLFFALWITSTLSFLDDPHAASWEWIRLAGIGICATLIFWGALQFTGRQRGQREMALLVFMMVLWSYIGRNVHGGGIWVSLPLYIILSLASFLNAYFFFIRRMHHRYVGAGVLGLGFLLWGILMAAHPFLEMNEETRPASYAAASVTQLVIAIGMIVLMLEEVRGEAISLRDQVKEDIRLARRLEKELRAVEGKYQHIFEHASDAILIVDPRSLQILECNRTAQSLTGYSPEELFRLRLVDLCSVLRDKETEISEDPSQIQKIFAAFGNIPIQRRDKNLVLTECSASVMSYHREPTVQIFLREVTERRRLEQQLRQAEKLSALGQLISGVAHELNNPLAVISGYAQLLSMRPAVDEKTRGDLLKIQRESERASKIVQNFLTFARKHPMEKMNVDLNKLVETSLELLDYDLRASGVRLVRELTPGLPEVFADPNQLEQVFLNIFNNAIHAMEGSPREKVLELHTEATATHVRLCVTDHGKGIPPAILGRIFDPFFTTKEIGVGTGLGLSISYSIIREHSGTIQAANHAKGGAVFTLELPISRIKKALVTDAAQKASGLRGPTRVFQVLVVDDEAAIQEVFAEMLSEYSCKVHKAGNGLLAFDLIQQQDFDLIISDLKMPGMDGRRLFEKVREIKPSLTTNFVFVTGDTNSERTLEFLQSSGNHWLHKPFNFREVTTLVSQHFKGIKAREEANASSAPS